MADDRNERRLSEDQFRAFAFALDEVDLEGRQRILMHAARELIAMKQGRPIWLRGQGGLNVKVWTQ